MPASPLDNADGPLRVELLAGGKALRDAAQLISVTVRRAVNTVPSATLVFSDGDMPRQEFPLSDADELKPGVEITVKAGYGHDAATIFSGIVVKHGVTIGGDNDARLVVECRDKAVKMTVGRRNAQYVGQTDSGIAATLIGAHGLAADVAPTTLRHAQLIQHYCTDWDFLLARAEASGCLVIVTDGTVSVAAPDTAGPAALKVGYGESLIEFEAELDATDQYAEVTARAWDAKVQALQESASARPAALNAQGNLDSKALARVLGLKGVTLQTGAALPKEALDAWAQAQQLKSGLSRLRGRMRVQGSALATVGGRIELAGVGARFSGTVLASGLTHRIGQGGWTTDIAFGTPAGWFTERPDIVAPPAAGWVPGIVGLQAGVVVKLDGDPAGEHRLQVSLPAAGVDSVWARLLQFHASSGYGAFFVPEVGDEVLLGFLSGDPANPVVLGSLYSSQRPPPSALAAGNKLKSIVTRCKARIVFNDEDKVITVDTPGGNSVVLSDKDKSITLADASGNKVVLDANGISMSSPKDITIDAKGAITVSAVGALTLGSKADTKVKGLNVSCDAQVGIAARGGAAAELSSTGQTTVNGAMVMIN